MHVDPLPLLGGALSFTPLYRLLFPKRGGGSSFRADYYYSMWLTHLAVLYRSGMTTLPRSVAELGPGGSLGVGLAALLSGVGEYTALDRVPHAESDINFAVLEGLVRLSSERAPTIQGAEFPRFVLNDDLLTDSLTLERITRIRQAIAGSFSNELGNGVRIRYVAPWTDAKITQRGSLDLILSHSVLGRVDDLPSAYAYFDHALTDHGWMSHWIDFKCHRTTSEWNGHWACGDRVWSILRGRKRFLINRQPLSEHLCLLEEKGFSVAKKDRVLRSDGISRRQLAQRFRSLSEDDLCTAGVQLVVRRSVRSKKGAVG